MKNGNEMKALDWTNVNAVTDEALKPLAQAFTKALSALDAAAKAKGGALSIKSKWSISVGLPPEETAPVAAPSLDVNKLAALLASLSPSQLKALKAKAK